MLSIQKKPMEPTLRSASHMFAPPHSRCSEMLKLDFYPKETPDKGQDDSRVPRP